MHSRVFSSFLSKCFLKRRISPVVPDLGKRVWDTELAFAPIIRFESCLSK